jgi:hypothetical protein
LQLIKRLKYLKPNAEFRAKFQYNNLMYIVLGALIERVSGMTWEEFVQGNIFDPLGMESSSFAVDNVSRADEGPPDGSDMSIGHKETNGKLEPWFHGWPEDTHHGTILGPGGPARSIVSNVEDMCRWLRLQINRGKIRRQSIISEVSLKEIHTPQVTIPDSASGYPELLDATYAMGWFAQPYRGYRRLFHGGSVFEFNAHKAFLPLESVGVVILSNTASSSLRNIISFTIFDRLLNLDPIRWNAREKRRQKNSSDKPRKDIPVPPKKRRKKPSLPLKEYTGTYRHPGYGNLSITMQDGELILEFNVYNQRLEPYRENVFRPHGPGRHVSDKLVTFHLGKTGRVTSLSIPLEPRIADIRFRKTVGKR